MPITTNAELLQYVEETFGVRIPQVRCCAGHQTPAEAFCNSYFRPDSRHGLERLCQNSALLK